MSRTLSSLDGASTTRYLGFVAILGRPPRAYRLGVIFTFFTLVLVGVLLIDGGLLLSSAFRLRCLVLKVGGS